jgi:two-component system, response regulator PdtaR
MVPATNGHPGEQQKYDGVILMVEDSVVLRSTVADHLRHRGFRVIEANDADDALDLLDATSIDLVFTDISMPGLMDGLQLTAFVRQRWPGVRVILTSGEVRPDAVAPELCVDWPLIPKPYDFDRLESVIRQVLGKARKP